MKSNLAQGTRLPLILSLHEIVRSPKHDHHYCYSQRFIWGFFHKGAELRGLENLNVLQKIVIDVNHRVFHNIHNSNHMKPEPQGPKGF